jgi:hypothetical protein
LLLGFQKPAPELAISGDSDDFIKQALQTDAGLQYTPKTKAFPITHDDIHRLLSQLQ